MRTLLAALLLVSLVSGCDALAVKAEGPTSCDNVAACEMTAKKYDLARFPIQVQGSKTFNVDGTDYSLVTYQYGNAKAAYATFVVNDPNSARGTSNFYEDDYYGYYEYPVDFYFTGWDDALFAPDVYYCDDFWGTCDYPGYDLPVFQDPYFVDWVYNTDVWFGPDLIDYYDEYYWY